jgi:hypothetical protein
MVEYIMQYIQLAMKMDLTQSGPVIIPNIVNRQVWSPDTVVREVAKELGRLDPRDFEPGFQCEFVRVRGNVVYLDTWHINDIFAAQEALKAVIPVLDGYRGPGSGSITRHFPYLHDPDLRLIIERDYIELSLKLFPSGAWKSTVIMAGSILEAILFDVLSEPKRVSQTNASPKGAKAKGSVPVDIRTDPDAWKLIHLIDVAVDTGILPADRGGTIDQVLRDYRNFVHPKKEIKAQHECTEAEAGLAKYGLDGVCNHFEKTL